MIAFYFYILTLPFIAFGIAFGADLHYERKVLAPVKEILNKLLHTTSCVGIYKASNSLYLTKNNIS